MQPGSNHERIGERDVADDFCRAVNKGTEQKGERLWNLVGVVERLRNRDKTDIEVGEGGGY
ncbi:MAG: hypothetical protein OXT74_15355 [Candidatus Poribacteria bacterium]|nr:hypothetical protein [Candidatus Poribacteria bacterium]